MRNVWLIIALFFPLLGLAQDYSHGHQALEIFDAQGMANTPTWVQIWVGFMGLCFTAGLLFVRNHVIARWVVGCFVVGAVFMLAVAPLFGIVRLSGFVALCHLIFWSPALYQLLRHRPFQHRRSLFTTWSIVMTGVILFSFIFDIRDAFIYLRHVLA